MIYIILIMAQKLQTGSQLDQIQHTTRLSYKITSHCPYLLSSDSRGLIALSRQITLEKCQHFNTEPYNQTILNGSEVALMLAYYYTDWELCHQRTSSLRNSSEILHSNSHRPEIKTALYSSQLNVYRLYSTQTNFQKEKPYLG